MKIAVLQTRISPYFAACLRELVHQFNVSILMFSWPKSSNAPFNGSQFYDLGTIFNRYDYSNDEIFEKIRNFKPDVVLTSGWRDRGYAQICRRLKSSSILIVAGCDTQWKGSLRQYLASLLAPVHIQKFIDVLWVTGERQRHLANALGYQGASCWDGYYACDWPRLAHEPQSVISNSTRPCFLYVGRYVPEKGLDTLADAYRLYCQQVDKPWQLVCAGAGPLRNLLLEAGAQDRGFVQPKDLPNLMQNASVFVLPSRFEPWGVVVHEATASGLPLIISDACGSGDHLLRPRHNGLSFPAGSTVDLARALKTMHELPDAQRFSYASVSYELSKQYTPYRWANTLVNGVAQLS